MVSAAAMAVVALSPTGGCGKRAPTCTQGTASRDRKHVRGTASGSVLLELYVLSCTWGRCSLIAEDVLPRGAVQPSPLDASCRGRVRHAALSCSRSAVLSAARALKSPAALRQKYSRVLGSFSRHGLPTTGLSTRATENQDCVPTEPTRGCVSRV